MAELYLHLEVDTSGITAKIIEPGAKQTLIREECLLLYSELDQTENIEDCFPAAMQAVSEKMALESCAKAVIFILDSFVSFRNVELPFKSEKKINQVIDFELESLMPDQEESHISDFVITGRNDNSCSVLSASIEEPIIESLFNALAPFNIRPTLVTPAGCAATAGFSKLHPNRNDFIFIQLFEKKATLVVIKDGGISLVRCFPHRSLSARKFAQSLRQTLTGIVQNSGAETTFELFICSDDTETDIASFYAAIEGIFADTVTSGQDNERIEPEPLICSISPERIPKGLLNFCKGEYRSSSFIQTYMSQIVATAVLIIAAFVLLLTGVSMENAGLTRQVSRVDQRANEIFKLAFPQVQTVRDPYMEMKANVRSALKKANSSVGPNADLDTADIKMVNLLGEISSRIDAALDMEISRYLFSSGRLVLSGSTDNFNNVDKIKSRLEASSLFEKVNISSAASDKRENRVNFKFVIDL